MKARWWGWAGALWSCAAAGWAMPYGGWTVGNPWSDGHATILRSTDSGVSWVRQGVGQVADVPLSGVFAPDPFTAWVVGHAHDGYGTIYLTTDGGVTWTRRGSPADIPNADLSKVHAYGDHVWAVGNNEAIGVNVILHSSDGGVTWTNRAPAEFSAARLQGVFTPDGVTVWVAGGDLDDHAPILKSDDGGLSWTRQSGGDVNQLDHVLGISAVDGNTAWAMGGGRVTTVDGRCLGRWTAVSPGRFRPRALLTATISSPWMP